VTFAFNTVVRRHKLGEVENECTSHKLVLFAIFMQKNFHSWWKLDKVLIKKIIVDSFLRHGIYVYQ